MRGKRHGDADEGAMLIIVLIFVLVVSVVCGGVVTFVQASVGRTLVVRDQRDKMYAADAGIEYALKSIARDNTLCADAGQQSVLPDLTVAGRVVHVTCDGVSGSASGALGYALVTLDNFSSALSTQSATLTCDPITDPSCHIRQVDGPVWSSGIDDSVDLVVRDGNVTERRSASTCSTDADKPARLQIRPAAAFGYHCNTSTAPDPHPALPASPPAAAVAPHDVTSTCRLFYPGTYAPPAGYHGSLPYLLPLAAHNYFASGVYYFDNVKVDAKGQDIEAGGAGPGINGYTACTDDSAATALGHPVTGSGTKWILGGSAMVHVENNTGSAIELFKRQSPGAGEGESSVGLMTVPPGTGGSWDDSTLNATQNSLLVDSGSNAAFTSYGLVYTPNAYVIFNATNTSQAQIRDGMVAARIQLQSSASASGLGVSVDTGVGQRQVRITASSGSGDKPITAVAVVDIDGARNQTIDSWRTTE